MYAHVHGDNGMCCYLPTVLYLERYRKFLFFLSFFRSSPLNGIAYQDFLFDFSFDLDIIDL